jgi:hypothetical protein
LTSSTAPSRGGSIKSLRNGPKAFTLPLKRSATSNCATRPFAAAFSRARSTSGLLPSKPITCAPRRAIGSEKLPSPQKRSATRSPGCGSSRRTARDTSTRFTARFTCVNSVGLKPMRTPNSGSA